METFSIATGELETIMAELQDVKKFIKNYQKTGELSVIDNNEFCKKMNISRRTSQSWRDEGRISYSQIGSKIFYKHEDILSFLEKNKISTLKKSSK